MKIRVRITIDEDVYKAAVNYSKLDNRTFSQLMQEAVKRMMHRFPKKEPKKEWYAEERLKVMINTVEKLFQDVKEIKAKIT